MSSTTLAWRAASLLFMAVFVSSKGRCLCSITGAAPRTATCTLGTRASTTSANPWGSLEHYRESSAPSRLPKPSKSSWEAPTPCPAGYCSSTSSKALSVPCKSPPWKGETLHIAKCTHEHGRTIQYNHIQSHEKKEEIQMLIPSHCTERVKTMPQP